MWKFGHNNWIKYGWGEEHSMTPKNPRVSLHIDFSECTRQLVLMTPIESAIDAVNKIISSYPAPYTLMCSGGVDSQAMIYAWCQSGAPFEIISVRYVSDGVFFNEYDLVCLGEVVKQHNVAINYKDIDVISFLENELQLVAATIDCSSPQICTHARFTDFVGSGTVIYSGNTLNLGGAMLSYPLLGLHRHSLLTSSETKRIIPFFFLHTPDLAYSLVDNMISGKMGSRYEGGGFEIIQPIRKYNGFEQLKEYYDKYSDRVTPFHKLRFANKPSNRVFDLLFRYPYHSLGKEGNLTEFNLRK